jgi:hypothetical protein
MIDLHVERLSLTAASRAMLWCMRMWVMDMKQGLGAEPRIGAMLEQMGAPAAAPPLKSFMSALSTGATRMIEVQCVCRPHLCADEQALLDVLGLAQALRAFEARLVLRGFTTPDGADRALNCATHIGTLLVQAGVLLPEPEEQVRLYALSEPARTQAFLSVVH